MTDIVQSEIDLLQTLCNWIKDQHRVVLATVVRTSGHTPRRVGAQFALREDGLFIGSVSGGCAEDDLIATLTSQFPEHPTTICFGGEQENARAALACGGEIELAIEPVLADHQFSEILSRIHSGKTVSRRYHIHHGNSELQEWSGQAMCHYQSPWLTVSYGSHLRLLIIGAVEIAHYLIPLAQMLRYQVSLCDPRLAYQQAWRNKQIAVDTDYPDDWLNNNKVDQHCAIVALTHDPRVDDMGLMVALASNAFYIGALGSQRSNQKRRERLAQLNITPQQLERLHGPVGLSIGSRSSAEIAVSITAQLVKVRNKIAVNARG